MSVPIPTNLSKDIELSNTLVESTAQITGSFYELVPGYASMKRNTVKLATSLFGRKWPDIRKAFVQTFDSMFADKSNQENIRLVMMLNTWKRFPVRTSHLFDYIFRFMTFANYHMMNTRHYITIRYRWPIDRPWPIKGIVNHTWPATGHSKPPIPLPKYTAPNARFISVGPKGGLLFALNDPLAVNEPTPYVNAAGINEIRSQMRNLFQGMKVILHMRNKNKSGAVTVVGAGSNIQIKP